MQTVTAAGEAAFAMAHLIFVGLGILVGCVVVGVALLWAR